jgi:hypothetical protein
VSELKIEGATILRNFGNIPEDMHFPVYSELNLHEIWQNSAKTRNAMRRFDVFKCAIV